MALVRKYCCAITDKYFDSRCPNSTILGMASWVRPEYKTKYHVGNWPACDRAIIQRGDVTLWLSADAVDTWKPAPSGRREAPRKFSDHVIETAPRLRLVFRLPLPRSGVRARPSLR